MSDFYEEAKKKLANGTVSADRKASAMAPAVKEALLSFCEQDAEFAQAVAQGGSFKDCMDAVAKGVKAGDIMQSWYDALVEANA